MLRSSQLSARVALAVLVWTSACFSDPANTGSSSAGTTTEATTEGSTASTVGTTTETTAAVTGGTTAASSSTTAGTGDFCEPSADDDECAVCSLTNCCEEAMACVDDGDCACLVACLGAGGTDCVEQCGATAAYFNLAGCFMNECPACGAGECTVPEPAPECTSCVGVSCCDELAACQMVDDCDCREKCFAGGGPMDACGCQDGEGPPEYAALRTCAAMNGCVSGADGGGTCYE